jgi:hypothetical protein
VSNGRPGRHARSTPTQGVRLRKGSKIYVPNFEHKACRRQAWEFWEREAIWELSPFHASTSRAPTKLQPAWERLGASGVF